MNLDLIAQQASAARLVMPLSLAVMLAQKADACEMAGVDAPNVIEQHRKTLNDWMVDRATKSILADVMVSKRTPELHDTSRLLDLRLRNTPLYEAVTASATLVAMVHGLSLQVHAAASVPSARAALTQWLDPIARREQYVRGTRVVVKFGQDPDEMEFHTGTVTKSTVSGKTRQVRVKFDGQGDSQVCTTRLSDEPSVVGIYYGPKRKSRLPLNKMAQYMSRVDVDRVSRIVRHKVPNVRSRTSVGDRLLVNVGTIKEMEIYYATITAQGKRSLTVRFDDGNTRVYTGGKFELDGILGPVKNTEVYSSKQLSVRDAIRQLDNPRIANLLDKPRDLKSRMVVPPKARQEETPSATDPGVTTFRMGKGKPDGVSGGRKTIDLPSRDDLSRLYAPSADDQYILEDDGAEDVNSMLELIRHRRSESFSKGLDPWSTVNHNQQNHQRSVDDQAYEIFPSHPASDRHKQWRENQRPSFIDTLSKPADTVNNKRIELIRRAAEKIKRNRGKA